MSLKQVIISKFQKRIILIDYYYNIIYINLVIKIQFLTQYQVIKLISMI